MGNINTKGPKMKAKKEKGMRSRNYHLGEGAKKSKGERGQYGFRTGIIGPLLKRKHYRVLRWFTY
jgi:hypothetical protein